MDDQAVFCLVLLFFPRLGVRKEKKKNAKYEVSS